MCVDSTWRDMSFLPGIIFPQVRHSHILCPMLFSIFRIKVLIWESSSSTVLWPPAKTSALDHILLKLHSTMPSKSKVSDILMHSGNVASERVPCLGEFSTEVATYARELDVCWLNVPRHVTLVGACLATGGTHPYCLTKLVGALLHEIIDLCVKFFKGSAVACKYFAFRPTAKQSWGLYTLESSWRVFHLLVGVEVIHKRR